MLKATCISQVGVRLRKLHTNDEENAALQVMQFQKIRSGLKQHKF